MQKNIIPISIYQLYVRNRVIYRADRHLDSWHPKHPLSRQTPLSFDLVCHKNRPKSMISEFAENRPPILPLEFDMKK